jgi:protein-disulfide isomerase
MTKERTPDVRPSPGSGLGSGLVRSWLARFRALSRARWVAGLMLLLILITTVLSGIGHLTRLPRRAAGPLPLKGTEETRELFRGIPQNDIVLGNAQAPVTLIEFADLQCPFCARVSVAVLPVIIDRYVRSGKISIVFRALSFVGPDSERAASMASSVGLQNHLWQFVHLFFENQRGENTGYVTDSFLGQIAAAIPGVNVERALATRNSQEVEAQLRQASVEGERLKVAATPAFFLQVPGRPPRPLPLPSLAPAAFEHEIDEALQVPTDSRADAGASH